jgi:hypothetical protein
MASGPLIAASLVFFDLGTRGRALECVFLDPSFQKVSPVIRLVSRVWLRFLSGMLESRTQIFNRAAVLVNFGGYVPAARLQLTVSTTFLQVEPD